jgi:signal transduction histidine kinase
VAILTWLLAGFALRPVERLRVQASAVSGTDRRLTVPLTGDEVQRLAVTLNEMLTRLDEASRTRRRFVADASHELRSPVASLRSIVDVTRAAGADLRPDVLEDLSTEIGRLEALIDDLLWLARSDEGDAPEPVREEVDLDQLVRQEAAAVRRRRPIGVDTTATRPARILGDPNALARLVRNLIDNAAHHAQRIWLRSEAADGWATVGVDDDGPGIPAQEREQVFERFVRLDPARAGGSGGYGLGLAVAREIARAHGGDVTVVESRRGGASLEVRLPALAEIP